MCILGKLNFKISRGTMPPDPPSVLAPSALDAIFVGLTINCFHRACYYQWVILNTILRILRTQRDVSFKEEKVAPSVLYRDMYLKDW